MNFFSQKNRILLKELIKTDFKLRYQGSFIGYLWSILKPLMMFTIMYLVFVRFLRWDTTLCSRIAFGHDFLGLLYGGYQYGDAFHCFTWGSLT